MLLVAYPSGCCLIVTLKRVALVLPLESPVLLGLSFMVLDVDAS